MWLTLMVNRWDGKLADTAGTGRQPGQGDSCSTCFRSMESLGFTRKKEEKKTPTEWGSNAHDQPAGAGLDLYQLPPEESPDTVPPSPCPPVCPSVPQSIRLSLSPSLNPSVRRSVPQSLRLPVRPLSPSIYPSVPQSLRPSLRRSVRQSHLLPWTVQRRAEQMQPNMFAECEPKAGLTKRSWSRQEAQDAAPGPLTLQLTD